MANIDIKALFKYSAAIFRQYASFIIGIGFTYGVLAVVPQIYFYLYAPKEPTLESQIISTILMLVQLFLSLGFIKIMLYLVDHREVSVSDLFNNGARFLDYFVAYFIYVIVVVVGLILLIVPGIYLAIRLQFYAYYIIDQDDSSFQALQKSWHASEDFVLELFLLGICVLFINFVGAMFFIVGLVFTYPLTTMVTAVVYRGLLAEADDIPTSEYLPEN